MKHVSYKGKSIDMELLKFQNQHSVALGNAHMNARGDIIGNGGLVLKTREELLQESEKELRVQDVQPQDIAVSSVSKSVHVGMEDDRYDDEMFNYESSKEQSFSVPAPAAQEEVLGTVKPKRNQKPQE